MNLQVKALVSKLEEYYDDQQEEPEQEEESPPLAPGVESFLREMGLRLD